MIRFLCDVHISYRITKFLATQGFEAEHINRILDSYHTKDRDICRYADTHDFIVITKDLDFRNSHFIQKTPRKLIRITLGNISNVQLQDLLAENLEVIINRCQNELCYLELTTYGLIVF